MPINQADKPINCIACGKIIAQGYIEEGSIKIKCKCGVMNRIEAEQKPEGQSELSKRVRSAIKIPKMEFINVNTSTSVSRRWP